MALGQKLAAGVGDTPGTMSPTPGVSAPAKSLVLETTRKSFA